jgi:hypothetical protein
VDDVLSSGDEATHSPKSFIPIDRKGSTIDGAEDKGTASAKILVTGPIGTDAHGKPKASVTDWVPIVPPSEGCNRKRLRITMRWSDLVPQVDQVMTQVGLPPYCGPHSLLDLALWRSVLDGYLKHFTKVTGCSC